MKTETENASNCVHFDFGVSNEYKGDEKALFQVSL